MESWQGRGGDPSKSEGYSHRLWIACSLKQAAQGQTRTPSDITGGGSRKRRQRQAPDSTEMNSIMVFSMISTIGFPAQLFNIHFFSFKFVPIMSLVFIFQFISNLTFCSSPYLTPFQLFPSSSYFCVKFYFFSCYDWFLFHTLTIPPPASQNHFSCHQSSHNLRPVLKIPLFSVHFYQSLLIGLYCSGCCISSILFLDLHYFCILNLKFYHSAPLFHFAFFVPFYFILIFLFPYLSLVFTPHSQHLFLLSPFKINFFPLYTLQAISFFYPLNPIPPVLFFVI